MSDRYGAYKRLKFDRPDTRILRITMENPGRLNAADDIMHGELTRVWRDIDDDQSVNAVIIRGAGKVFGRGQANAACSAFGDVPPGVTDIGQRALDQIIGLYGRRRIAFRHLLPRRT